VSDPESCATILLYHGVTASPSTGIENFSGKHMPVSEFDRQMAWLAGHASVLPLRELAERLARRAVLPSRAVAVTFDDSFKNVHDVALPVLRRYGVPATFFVTSGFVGSNRRFWVDRIEHWINRTSCGRLDLMIGDTPFAVPIGTREQRIEAVSRIKQVLKNVRPVVRESACAALQQAAGVADSGDDVDNYANMRADDVARLDAPPAYEVGGHTVNHEILSYLDAPSLQYEVRECQRQLRDVIGRPVDLFSYPEGQAHHFNETVIGGLKRADVVVCPTAIWGFNPPGTDSFWLKRIMPGFMGTAFPFDQQ
jgi:peptidoglycan/xylan/chitin deacetylase (PgdA/CDA1 family)